MSKWKAKQVPKQVNPQMSGEINERNNVNVNLMITQL